MLKKLLICISVVFFVGCSSGSGYKYYVDPVPIIKGVTKYKFGSVKVHLILGHGAIEGDTTFASEDMLNQEFLNDIKKFMHEQGILAAENQESPIVDISIDYTRTFNYGGKALNKPAISHQVSVSQNGKILATFGRDNYTTKYAYLKDAAVNIEIAAFLWDEEDEPQDVNLISKLIVEDLAGLGE